MADKNDNESQKQASARQDAEKELKDSQKASRKPNPKAPRTATTNVGRNRGQPSPEVTGTSPLADEAFEHQKARFERAKKQQDNGETPVV